MPKARILDWGCGAGNFVEQQPGVYFVDGYDVNPNSPYNNYMLYRECWDAVTLWDVLEHIPSVHMFLRDLHTKYVFISTPNATGLETLEGWKHFKPGEHQHYFTELSLTWLMARAGFELLETSFIEGKLRDPQNERAILTTVGRRK